MSKSTAARLALVRRDKYGRALNPARSSGTPYTGDAGGGPIGLGAEIYLGAQGWTDITPYVLYRDSSQFVTVNRGRPDEMSASIAQPQTVSFQLNNRDNRFSPRNPAGPYYRLIGRNTPIRFFRMQNGLRRYRFHGEVVSWPTTADLSGNDVWVSMNAAGMLRRLAQGAPLTESALKRAFTKAPISTYPNTAKYTVAYWSCEDGTGSGAIASSLPGGSPMGVYGSPQYASDSSFTCSNPIPVLNNSHWSAYAPAGVSWTDNVVRFLLHVPSGGDTDGAVLARIITTGAVHRLDLVYNTAFLGSLTLNGYNTSGTSLFSLPADIAVNGALKRVSMELRAAGTGITYAVSSWTDPEDGAGAFTGTLASSAVGSISIVSIAPSANLAGTSVGHVSVHNAWEDLSNLAAVLRAWPRNRTDRLVRLCQENGVNEIVAHGTPGPNGFGDGSGYDGQSLMGLQTPDTFLNLVQQCTDTDGGVLFEARDQVALVWRPRLTLYNQGTAYGASPSQLTLDFAQNQLSAQLAPVDDDAYTRNDVTVTQIGGSSARQYLNDGSAMSISDPPTGIGEYQTSYNLSVGPDGFSFPQMSIADHAGWRLHLGTVNEARYPQVSINLRHPTFTGNLDRMNAALMVDIGDVIEIDNPPAWLPPDPIRLIILGYSETMGIWEHGITFVCAPESPYRVFVTDDPVLGRADTDGSTLSSPLSDAVTANPFFSGGSLAGWTGSNCALSPAGTSGSATPLPSGGPAGYGVLITPDGSTVHTSVNSSLNLISALPNTPYQVSCLVYSPLGFASGLLVGITSYDSSMAVISSSTLSTAALAAGTWTAFSTERSSAAGTAYISIRAGHNGAPSSNDLLYVASFLCWSGETMVATTGTGSGSPLWTTAAADFPFDIAVGGERMTVTAVSGSSSPQTFTVARGVNGVSKPQTTGTDVRLWQPPILSL